MLLRGTVYAKSLGMDTDITVFAPTSIFRKTSYRVVYLLHGLMSNSDSMVDYTMLPAYADKYNAIIVMPDVGRSFYTDMKYGENYFQYVSQELPRICQRVFRISSKRENTAVIGVSMGGYGAIKCALAHPENYAFCGALSPGGLYLGAYLDKLRGLTNSQDPLRKLFVNAFGENLQYKPQDDPLTQARIIRDAPEKPKFYCACGAQDEFAPMCRTFQTEMNDLGFDFTYEEWEGAHNWQFFDEALQRALPFCLPHFEK